MAPATPQGDEKDNSHQLLLDQLDIANTSKPFRSTNWKPSQRRNKNVKQVVSETQRKEASALATQNNSGATTPQVPGATGASDGTSTPAATNGVTRAPNIAQAAQSLSTLVLEKNLQRATLLAGPAVTYTNIESAPSLHPAHQKHYCDLTGLPAKYKDPKTRLWYHDKEVFSVLRTLPQGVPEQYLAVRGAHTILK